jgi:hypothetical protein
MPSDASLFLETSFGGKPDELYLLLWTLPEKRSHWFQNVESAIQFAESLRERDLYVGVGLSSQDHGSARRCPSNEVAGIVGLWADLDLKSDAHPKAALPATVEDAMTMLPDEFPPTFLVKTGNGAHAWWLFREPLIFESDEDRRNAGALALRWQSLLRLNAAAHGWAFDRLADLARVLRVPGTKNCKDPANPKPVAIQSQTDRRYNPSDFVEFLEAHGVANPKSRSASRRDGRRRSPTSHCPLTRMRPCLRIFSIDTWPPTRASRRLGCASARTSKTSPSPVTTWPSPILDRKPVCPNSRS